MFARLLLYVDERPESLAAAGPALRLARLCDARLFAVSVVPESPNSRRRRRREPGSEPEEQAWSRLYEIEDDAFEQEVKISLLLESGSRDERILALIDSYQADALILGSRSLAGWEQLIERCSKPVILLR
jgi:nucleotide-binding universal stress UspA family protein